MPFTPAQLQAELQTDPTQLGYAAAIASGSDAALVTALTLVRTTINVNREPISDAQFVALIDRTEYATISATDRDWLHLLCCSPTIDLNDPVIQPALNTLFPVGTFPVTRPRLIAALTRHGSRAEQLWGTGATVTVTDIAVALRGA